LADENDRHGLPVAHFSHSLCDNDKALVEAATKVMEDMHHAAGAAEAIIIMREAHLIGGCRMGADDTAWLTPICAPSLRRTSSSLMAACVRRKEVRIPH
jgi:hypothetical protein